MKYNYTDILEEINEDVENGILGLEDDLYVIRKTEPLFDDYRPILDYEYQDIPEDSFEKIRVSWVLKEMNDMNA